MCLPTLNDYVRTEMRVKTTLVRMFRITRSDYVPIQAVNSKRKTSRTVGCAGGSPTYAIFEGSYLVQLLMLSKASYLIKSAMRSGY